MRPDPSIPKDEDEDVLLNALREIQQRDCWGQEDENEPCNCPVCIATAAIKAANGWRFEAALKERVTNGFHPAEARMVEAWRRYMADDPDRRLAQILHLEGPWEVSRRDWYTATSVVQWLATNVGSTIVEQAGYKYTKYDEDRKAREEKLPPTLGEVACPHCYGENATGRAFCGYCGREAKGRVFDPKAYGAAP